MKPVELLIKSLNDVTSEQSDVPFAAVRVMHESYEKERRKFLQGCPEEEERITLAHSDRWPSWGTVSGLETRGWDSTEKDRHADQKSVKHVGSSSKRADRSTSLSSAATRNLGKSNTCSCSLGDLRHSTETEIKLKSLTEDIKRKMKVTLSQRDRKIAALMLVRHQEELSQVDMARRDDRERQEAQKKQEAERAREEKSRRRRLGKSMQRWQEELEFRKHLRLLREKEEAGLREKEMLLQDSRWRVAREEVEEQQRDKMKASQREALQRKLTQEKLLRDKEELEKRELEREREFTLEREEKARKSKELQERKERQRLKEENHREHLWHVLLKKQQEEQVEEQKVQRRSALERKLQHSSEKRAQAAEARLMELQERARREERQIQTAQLKVKLQSVQQLTHKQLLVQKSQRRMERAEQHVSAQQRVRAQQTRRANAQRRHSHQRLIDRVQREEEEARKATESRVVLKEGRRERLRRQQEETREEAHRAARASFHMRERVRQQTQRRTFDRMALEAQLTASIGHMTL